MVIYFLWKSAFRLSRTVCQCLGLSCISECAVVDKKRRNIWWVVVVAELLHISISWHICSCCWNFRHWCQKIVNFIVRLNAVFVEIKGFVNLMRISMSELPLAKVICNTCIGIVNCFCPILHCFLYYFSDYIYYSLLYKFIFLMCLT